MIKLIVGNKGSGTTKTMIEMINESAKSNTGSTALSLFRIASVISTTVVAMVASVGP